jgi:hypothetical protein
MPNPTDRKMFPEGQNPKPSEIYKEIEEQNNEIRL